MKSAAVAIDPHELGKPEDVAAVIAFLVSDEPCFVQEANLVVDGEGPPISPPISG